MDVAPVELDAALRHLAAVHRAASPVIARSRVVLPAPLARGSATIELSGNLEAHTPQDEDDVAVDHLEVVDGEHQPGIARGCLLGHLGCICPH